MEENGTSEEQPSISGEKPEFKKPVLVGRVGKLPKKAKSASEIQQNVQEPVQKPKEPSSKPQEKSLPNLPPAVLLKEMSTPIPYKEPKWSGLCPDGSEYGLEVLKSGMIVERLELTKKPYYVVGRLANSDIVMAHPTISRHHAVLQYKAFAEEGEPPSGWYIFDLGSTHGTFLNKDRLKSNHYTRLRVGHQIKFGSSSRTYILLGPDFDCEGESELTVTEIKRRANEMKKDRDRMIQEAIEQREKDRLEEERKKEEQGIDWGMGEDAEEETDLSENPYAAATNEELYLTDPKKTLRGYFEREAQELNYDCEERGVGQFICRVELPMDDARGRPVVAEVIHKGKKKEAVVACALEACRILDRAGLLRQATHESRRRKKRDWSAEDYYDSDEDTFLDRTGAVERKRASRMKRITGADDEQKSEGPLTYEGLLKQIKEIEIKMAAEERSLTRLRERKTQATSSEEADSLDDYMNSLGKQGHSMAEKAEISTTKMRIQKLKAELTKSQRLADLARPAHLPPLIKKDEKTNMVVKQTNSVVYGKRIRLKDDAERKPKIREPKPQSEEFTEEVDSDEEEEKRSTEKEAELDNRMSIEEKGGSITENVEGNNKEVTKKEEEGSRSKQEVTKKEEEGSRSKQEVTKKEEEGSRSKQRMFGPMRPPENYVIPDSYFEQSSDRDLPEIIEDE